MIAEDDEGPDPCRFEAAHLINEEQPGLEVAQLPVEQVASEQDESATLVDRERDQILERIARSAVTTRSIVGRSTCEAEKGTVEMKVGGVEKLKHYE